MKWNQRDSSQCVKLHCAKSKSPPITPHLKTYQQISEWSMFLHCSLVCVRVCVCKSLPRSPQSQISPAAFPYNNTMWWMVAASLLLSLRHQIFYSFSDFSLFSERAEKMKLKGGNGAVCGSTRWKFPVLCGFFFKT